jgi:hypothetical protein
LAANQLDDTQTFEAEEDLEQGSEEQAAAGFGNFPTDIDSEMTLKFDIQRPILDSILPKYCYLKYLSRASVANWNCACIYPYYEDLKSKNIRFEYRQKGNNFVYILYLNNKCNSKY